jgi:hypothetical protein
MQGGPAGPNAIAGKALLRLYKGRILYGQDFFNRFATELTNVEPMAYLCWKPIDTTST